MKPEQNPKSPLNAKFMITKHFGSRICVMYCGNNENLALQNFNALKWMTAREAGKKMRPGTIKVVIKFWDLRCTVKEGKHHDANLLTQP